MAYSSRLNFRSGSFWGLALSIETIEIFDYVDLDGDIKVARVTTECNDNDGA